MSDTKINAKLTASLGFFIFCIVLYNMITPTATFFNVTIGLILLALFWTWIIEIIIVGVVLGVLALIAIIVNA